MKKEALLFLVAILAFAGCVTMGKPFPGPGGAVAIESGKTTQQEIQKTYGAPDMQGTEDGDTTWTYVYLKAGVFNAAEAEQLTVRFNKDGTVRSYNFNSNVSSR